MLDDEHPAGAFDAARRPDVVGDERHLLIEQRLVGHRNDPDVAHQLKRPAGVVVRRRILRRVVLNREVHLGQRPERLIAAHDVVAGADLDGARPERRRGARDLEALPPQIVDGDGGVRLAPLRRGNHPAVHRALPPFSTARLFFSQ